MFLEKKDIRLPRLLDTEITVQGLPAGIRMSEIHLPGGR